MPDSYPRFLRIAMTSVADDKPTTTPSDTARLDWLQADSAGRVTRIGTIWYVRPYYGGQLRRCTSLRAAIDAAQGGA